MMEMQEETRIRLISDHIRHVIIYHVYSYDLRQQQYIQYTTVTDCYWLYPIYRGGTVQKRYTSEGYIRTLIHVLSSVLRDCFSFQSIGYLSSSDSSALNQQLSIRTQLALFLYFVTLSDYLFTEPGWGDIPSSAFFVTEPYWGDIPRGALRLRPQGSSSI